MTTPPTSCTKPTLLTTSILIALGVGFGIPALANGGIVSLTKPNQGLRCIGTVKHNSKGSSGTNLCPAPSATSVRSNNPSPTAFGGNPINLLTGNKFEQLLDIDEVGDAFALRLTRYYNSQSTQRGIFGIGWRSDYELQLQDLGDNVQILTADGGLYHFNKQQIKDDSTGLLSERFVPDDISLGYVEVKPISHHTNALGDEMIWQWHLPDGRVMEFAPHRQVDKVNTVGRYQYGQLSRVQKLASNKNTQTLYWQLHYNTDGKLARVSNNLGQVLRFEYQTNDDGLSYINVSKEGTKIDKQVWQYRLDKIGNLIEVVTHQGGRLGYEYGDPNDKHNLTAKYRYIQDNDKDSSNDGLKKQLISRFAYDAYDRAILSTGKGDTHKISVSYDDKATYSTLGDTYTNTLTNSLGQTTQYRYTYDKTGIRLLSAIGVGCMTCNQSNVRYEYNKEGRVIAKHTLVQASTNPPTPTNFVGNDANIANEANILSSERYIYDDFGRVVKTIVQDHIAGSPTHTTNTTYISNDKDSPAFYLIKSISTDSVFAGKQTGIEYDYDDRGNVIRVKEFGFDGGGNVFERTVYYSYNAQGLLDKIELSTDDIKNNSNYAKTELIRFTYNKKGQPIEVREQGLHTKYGYDNQGNLNLITYPDGQTVHYTYNTHNKPTHIKMGNQFVMMDYDDRQRPIHYNNHLGQTLDIDYDDVAHTINYTLANGQVVSDVYSSEYDLIKRSIKDSQGKVIFTSLGSEMMNNGLSTQNSTNPINTLIINNAPAKLTLNTGATYTRHYDDFGRVYLATDANTGKRYIRYDNFDRPTQIMLDGINQELSYNSFGLPNTFKVCNISSNTQDCQYTHYHYDTYGKLTKVQHSQTQDGKTPSIQHQYTNTGLLASETTTLISHQGYTTAYHYDDKDRIKSVTLPEGITLHYHYNTHSQVTQIDYQTPTNTLWQTLTNKWYKVFNKDNGDALLSNIQADSTRGLLALTHANGSTVHQVYDDKARLIDKHDHTTSTKLSYDKQTGQITSIDDNGNVKTVAEVNNAYEYDDNGNHTKHHHTHYTYKPNSDRLSTITIKDNQNNIIKTTHYTYDNLGNPVMITTKDHKGNIISQRALTYTPDGQIKSIRDSTQDKQGNKTEKLIATYQYNHLRQRIAKSTYHKDDKTGQIKEETTQYLWDKGLLSAEIKDDKVVRRYIYLDIMPVMPVAILDYTYNQKGKLDKTEVYSIHTDHLGTPKQITNQNQEVVWIIEMDAFGETKSIDSKDNFTFNLRFAGQYFDQESGYHYNYHRYYDPSIGRYLTSDPIGLNGGSFNTYAYVDNEVWRAVDPWGLYTVFIGGAADAEPFLGQGPTGIMQDVRRDFRDKYLQPYFEKAGYSQDRARQLASRNARYYGFHELHLMLADAKMYLSTQGNENAKINIVGHSLGGWQAAHLAQQLEEWRCGSVGVVTTLDPVGVRYSYNLAGSINFKTPNPKYKTWVNIRAEAKDTSINDVIANLGGQWDPSSLNPTYNYTLEVDHVYARTMFTTKIPNRNLSPRDLINRSYLNNKNIKEYERATDVGRKDTGD